MSAEIRTIQCWPHGTSYTYVGDPFAPFEDRTREIHRRDGTIDPGTPDEWREIRVAVVAERYVQNDILWTATGLVDDLIRAAMSGDLRGDLAREWDWDTIANLAPPDPDSMDLDELRAYADRQDIDLPLPDPEVPTIACSACEDDDRPETGFGECAKCGGTGEVPDSEFDAEDDPDYLDDVRRAVQRAIDDGGIAEPEVFEWYAVSSWLARSLQEIGEIVIDNAYGYFWGRTCTGQGILQDGTLQTIAARGIRE